MSRAKKGAGKDSPESDDIQVWRHAAATVEPLRRAKGRVHTHADSEGRRSAAAGGEARAAARGAAPKAALGVSLNAKQKAATSAVASPAPARAQPAPPLSDFDRKKVRKIRAGRVEIEARIDLHGMRQDEAHAALRAFIGRAVGKGQRWVLVITGKGKSAARDDDYAPFALGSERGRGILRQNVPRWLDEPDLRRHVVSYATAAIQHGGEGALYVHLRTKGR